VRIPTFQQPLYHTTHLLALSAQYTSPCTEPRNGLHKSKRRESVTALANDRFDIHTAPGYRQPFTGLRPVLCLLTNGSGGRTAGAEYKRDPSNLPPAEIVITKYLSFPVYLASCSALSSEHLPVLINTACRSSAHLPPDRPDFRRTAWANFATHLEN